MIRDCDELRRFEKDLAEKESPDFLQNLALVESLYEEARALGEFPLKNPLDGIENDIALARAINSV